MKRSDNHDVDNFGECDVKWSKEKVHINDLMSRYVHNDKVDIQFLCDNNGELKIQKKTVTLDLVEPFKISTKYPPIQNIDYVIIGGLVIMELTNNHINDDVLGCTVNNNNFCQLEISKTILRTKS